MKRISQIILISAVTLSPALVFGADFTLGGNSTLKTLIFQALAVINVITPILSALAFIVFFWGLSRFILHSGEQKTREEGKQRMMWGILALFIMLTFRAIIGLVSNELEIGNNGCVPDQFGTCENGVLLRT